MSEIANDTHQAIADIITTCNLPESVWRETLPQLDGSIYAQIYDADNNIYFWHNPGTPEGARRNNPNLLNSSLTYPVVDGNTAIREWIIEGPDKRNPHDSLLDGPTGTEASISIFDYDGAGNIIEVKQRFSRNPDRTYRALAQLAKIATLKANGLLPLL